MLERLILFPAMHQYYYFVCFDPRQSLSTGVCFQMQQICVYLQSVHQQNSLGMNSSTYRTPTTVTGTFGASIKVDKESRSNAHHLLTSIRTIIGTQIIHASIINLAKRPGSSEAFGQTVLNEINKLS